MMQQDNLTIIHIVNQDQEENLNSKSEIILLQYSIFLFNKSYYI